MRYPIYYTLLFITCATMLLTSAGCKSYYLGKYCHPDDFMTVRDSINFRDSVVLHIKDSTRLIITKGGSMEANINNPCDSAGMLRTFEQRFKNGSNTTTIKSDGKNLYVKSDCEDQITEYKSQIQSLVSELQSYQSIHVKEVATIKPDTQKYFLLPKFWVYSALSIVFITAAFILILYKLWKHQI